MAKDYGRRGNQRSGSNAPRRLLGVVVAFLGGYLAATIFDFSSLSTWVNDHLLREKQLSQPQPKVAKRQEQLPKPKFEFYTLLSKDNSAPEPHHPAATPTPAAVATQPAATPVNQIPAAALASVPTAATPAVPVTQSKPVVGREAYLVQVAAFNRRPDAENLKASLVLKGFDVSITTIATQQGVNWYRVMIGPFTSHAEAQKAQAALARSEHIKGLIRKFDA